MSSYRSKISPTAAIYFSAPLRTLRFLFSVEAWREKEKSKAQNLGHNGTFIPRVLVFYRSTLERFLKAWSSVTVLRLASTIRGLNISRSSSANLNFPAG